ncbi:MAG: hypothetical protein AAFQ16_12020, partial [Pseudomonadota bacterium]
MMRQIFDATGGYAKVSDEQVPTESTALKLYFDATNTIRHYDGERTATHRVALAVLGALLAFTSSDIFVPDQMIIPVSVVGASLSILFLLMTKKIGALVDRERAKARAAAKVLADLGDCTI